MIRLYVRDIHKGLEKNVRTRVLSFDNTYNYLYHLTFKLWRFFMKKLTLLAALSISACSTAFALNPGDIQITNSDANVVSYRLELNTGADTASTGYITANDYRVLTNGAMGGVSSTTYKVQFETPSNPNWSDVPYSSGINYDSKFSYTLSCSQSSCTMNAAHSNLDVSKLIFKKPIRH